MTVLRGPWRPVDAQRHELGEGARYVGGRTGFVLVDLLAGRLIRTGGGPGDGLEEVLRLDEPLGAVAPTPSGWIAAAGEGLLLLDDDGTRRWLGRPASGRGPLRRMNDAVADGHGRFWAGVMAYDGSEDAGVLVRLDADGSVRVVLDGLTVPNGPVFSLDGRILYLADTPTGRITAHDVDPGSGSIGPAREFVTIPDGRPDGMTVDAQGCVWAALWGAGELRRWDADGRPLETIEVPASQPTSIALSSERPYRVLVTTATYGIERPSADDGRVLSAPVSVPGVPVARWELRPRRPVRA